MCMHVRCVCYDGAQLMEEETVPPKMERSGPAVMMDQLMTPCCPVGSLGFAEAWAQAQVQQVSCLTGPVAVRLSAEIWREMEERGACPMCQRKREKTKTLDLRATGSAETQSQVGKKEKKTMREPCQGAAEYRRRRKILQLTWQVHYLPPAFLFPPPSCRQEERPLLFASCWLVLLPGLQGSDWLQECLGWGQC